MKQFPVRPVLAGVLIAAVIFLAPFFLLRAALFILLIAGAAKLLGFGRRGRWMSGGRRPDIGWSHAFQNRRPSPTVAMPARDITID